MYTIIYSSHALNELEQAVDWYEEQQAGRGDKFVACIREKLAYLQQHGDRHPVTKAFFREFHVGTYPYFIIYRLNRRKKVLFVASFFHTSRNPHKKYRK